MFIYSSVIRAVNPGSIHQRDKQLLSSLGKISLSNSVYTVVIRMVYGDIDFPVVALRFCGKAFVRRWVSTRELRLFAN